MTVTMNGISGFSVIDWSTLTKWQEAIFQDGLSISA